jgi:hypothetical protein
MPKLTVVRRDQLGNKITKGVSNQLKNQAINKTEGFVNNKANTFLNAFGAGRSEVSFFEKSGGLVVFLGGIALLVCVRLAEV